MNCGFNRTSSLPDLSPSLVPTRPWVSTALVMLLLLACAGLPAAAVPDLSLTLDTSRTDYLVDERFYVAVRSTRGSGTPSCSAKRGVQR